MRWEYKVETWFGGGLLAAQAQLNTYGQEGWEAFKIDRLRGQYDSVEYFEVYLKRPVAFVATEEIINDLLKRRSGTVETPNIGL